MLRDEIEKVLEEEFKKAAHIDTKEVIKEVDKHGLLNPEKWDNPEAGFFNVKDYFKQVSIRILDLVEKCVPEMKNILSKEDFNTMSDEAYALKQERNIGYNQALTTFKQNIRGENA